MPAKKTTKSVSRSRSGGKAGGSRSKGDDTSLRARRQTAAVLLFAGAILLLCMVLIPGEKAWGALHGLFLGLFGICAYILPLLMMALAVLIALERATGSVSAKLWESVALIVMLGSAIQIFSSGAAEPYLSALKHAYENGAARRGGGVLGALLGYPLEYFFTDTGAKIIILLLIAVFLMLVTGTTIIGLFRTAVRPVKKARETLAFAMEESERAGRERPLVSSATASPIDIDLGGGYAPPDKPPRTDRREAFERAARELKEEDAPAPAAKPMTEKPAADAKAEKADRFAPPDPPAEEDGYHYPPISLLDDARPSDAGSAAAEQKTVSELLVKTLKDFGISTRIVDVSRGPTVTRYELEPSAGVKISRITGLADDLALRLATTGVRIEAPIPNKAAVGIEVPNRVSSGVCLRELIDSREFRAAKSPLTVSLGKDISGSIVLADLAKMPHLLIAGTTGSGKSVCTNAMIQSVLYKSTPTEVRMLLIDPKQVEFGIYNGIPHLLVPVVTDPRKAAGALGWAVTEMLARYKLFAENNVRDLASYNELAKKSDTLHPMPLILIVIDELADLMMAAANEVEDAIIRLAQMARAAGMHLVIATQRPSVDVITGLIKANIPSRLALTVASAVDSRTILDTGGAEKLLGRGDMLFMPVGLPKPMRVQGCFVSNREVESVVHYLKDAEDHEYDDAVIDEINRQAESAGKSAAKNGGDGEDNGEEDDMMNQAIEAVVEAGQASTSLLQRRLRLGYARAGRIIDQMEQRGIVGPYEGSKPRQVLLSRQQWHEMQMNRGGEED